MTDITPPEFSNEQLDQWLQEAPIYEGIARYRWLCKAAIAWATPIAAQEAANAELEACIRELDFKGFSASDLDALRAARRPSLKDQAIKALCPDVSALTDNGSRILSPKEQNIILRALESIPDEPTNP